SPEENLRVLEKLGKLKKAGIISQKEFQQKKKQLLKDI
ncbi:MAG: SHOCT domain-containing protein, partial [Nitrosopumilaceae archaeon]